MEGYIDLLIPIIEFSIGLGGFSAVVSVFLHRNGDLAPPDLLRVMNLLFFALGPAFMVFIAIGLLHFTDSPMPSFRYATGALGLYISAVASYAIIARNKLPVQQKAILRTSIFISMIAVSVVNAMLQFLATLGFIDGVIYQVFYAGLIIMLAQGFVQFVRLIIARPITTTDT